MKRIVILICLMFVVTGCTVNYQVFINDDLTVTETVNAYEDDDFYDIYYKTSKSNALKMFLDEYKNTLDGNNYQYEVIKDSNPYVLITKKYSTMQDYLNNSKLFNDYFDEIKYSKDNNIVKIETVGFNQVDDDVPERFYIDKVEIAITSSYNVTNSNAVRINKKTNTYYFEIDKTMDDVKIVMEYDTSSKFNPNRKLYIMMIVAILIMIASWIFVVINKKKKI